MERTPWPVTGLWPHRRAWSTGRCASGLLGTTRDQWSATHDRLLDHLPEARSAPPAVEAAGTGNDATPHGGDPVLPPPGWLRRLLAAAQSYRASAHRCRRPGPRSAS